MKSRLIRTALACALVIGACVAAFAWNLRIDARQLGLDVALSSAVKADNLPEIRRLISAGADPNTPTAFRRSNEGPLSRLLRMLFRRTAPQNGSGETALFRAASHQDADLIRILLAKGANVNVRVSPGYTPLHLAAGMDDTYDVEDAGSRKPPDNLKVFNACKMLLEAGADPNVGNPYDGTPFRYAIHSKSDAIDRLFLAHHANWTYRDRFTLTCLWDAVDCGRESLLRTMLANGGNANETESRHKVSVLMIAAENNDLRIVKLLVEAGANVNACDDGQMHGTALYEAVSSGKRGIAKFLLEQGAKPDLISGTVMRRQSPLAYAESHSDAEMLKLLRSASGKTSTPK